MCAAGKEIEPLDDGCHLRVVPKYNHREHARRWVRLAVVCYRDSWAPFAHYNCIHNQHIAVANRVLGRVPKPTAQGLAALRAVARHMKRHLRPTIKVPDQKLADWFTGARRKRYALALERARCTGVTRKDAAISLFVKCEKLNPNAKVNPDPRAIQFRGYRYGAVLATYLKPMEHQLYNFQGGGIFPRGRLIGKGLSSVGRAQLIVQKWRSFVNPVAVSIDASRFDKHVSLEVLRIEHSIYLKMNPSPELQRLLSYQLRNVGRSREGMRYKTRGRRMSGDMNTALGNCIIMVLMVAAWCRGRKYDILDDGDDCLVFLEKADLTWAIASVGPAFLEFGMEVKVEAIAYEIEEIEWCQSRPVQVGPEEWRMVRNPSKVLGGALGGFKYFEQSIRARRRLVNTIGLGELACNAGVPVLQDFALSLVRISGTTRTLSLDSVDQLYYRVSRELRELGVKTLADVKPRQIWPGSRFSYFKAWGVPAHEQVELERYFRAWMFSLGGDVAYPCDVGPNWDLSHRMATRCSYRPGNGI